MKTKMSPPILITGCARSGTSLTAGIVHYCGAFIGDVTGRMPHNKKGQFENKAMRNGLVKPALVKAGCDRLGQKPLPNIDTFPIDPEWAKKVQSIFMREGYKKGPWAYKGAKMCLFWTQWHHAFPNAKWIIVRRHDEEIINSCLKTGFMRAYKDAKGWQKWIDEHKKRFDEMHEAGLDIQEVWPINIIEGRYGEMKTVISRMGLNWNRDMIHEFIEPRLWTKRKDIKKRKVKNGKRG